MMEPYRSFVDKRVFELYESGKKEVDKEVKKALLELFYLSLKRDVLFCDS